MPDITTLIPTDIETRSEKERRQALQERRRENAERRQGFLGELGLAVDFNTLTAQLLGPEEKVYEPDPEHIGFAGLSEKEQNEIIEGPEGFPSIPPEYVPQLEGSVNMRHLRNKASQIRRTLLKRQALSEGGASAVTAQILSPFIDPAAFALEGAIGGPVFGALRAARAGRAARIGGIAATTGVTEGGIEASLAMDQPDRGMGDVAIATIGGALLGTTFGGAAEAFQARRAMALKRAHRQLRAVQRAAEGRMTPSAVKLAKGAFNESERRVFLEGVARRAAGTDMEDEIAEAVQAGDIDAVVERMGIAPEPRADEDAFGNRVPDDAEAERQSVSVPGEIAGEAEPQRLTVTRDPESVRTKLRDPEGNLLVFSGVRGTTREAGDVSPFYTINPRKAADYADIDEGGGTVRVVRASELPEDVFSDAEGTEIFGAERYFDEISNDVGVGLLRSNIPAVAEITADEARRMVDQLEPAATGGERIEPVGELPSRGESVTLPDGRSGTVSETNEMTVDLGGGDTRTRRTVTVRLDEGGTETFESGDLTQPQQPAEFTITTAREVEAEGTPGMATEGAGGSPPTRTAQAGASEGEPTPPPPKRGTDLWLVGNLTDERPRWIKFGISMYSQLARLNSPTLRKWLNAMITDPIAKAGRAQSAAMDEWVMRMNDAYFNRHNKVNDEAFKRWAASNGRSNTLPNKDEFNELVGKAVRRQPGAFTSDPAVNESADNMRELLAELLGVAQRHGVRGLEEVGTDPTFLPRLWAKENVDALVQELSRLGIKGADGTAEGAVADVVATALRNAQPKLDPDLAPSIAKVMLRKIREIDQVDPRPTRALAGQDRELMRQWLQEARDRGELNATDEKLEEVVRTFVRTPEPSGVLTNRAKPRNALDETTVVTLRGEDGQTREVAIEELFNNDATDIMALYTKQITGASAESELLRAFSAESGNEIASFDTLKARIRSELQREGRDNEIITDDLETLETLRKTIRGNRMGNNTRYSAAMRMLQLLNYLRVGTKFGVAQLPEFGVAVSQAGLGATMRAIPEIRTMFRQIRSGKVTHQGLKELQHVFGAASTRANDQVTKRMDNADVMTLPGGGPAERQLRRLSRLTNRVSGMAAIHEFQTTLAAQLALQKVTDIVYSRGTMGARRLKQLGLSEEFIRDRVAKQMKKYSGTEEGLLGVRFRAANFDQWDDQEAAAVLIGAVTRAMSFNIQRMHPALLSRWMTKEWGRGIIQFRTFHLQSIRLQLMREADAASSGDVGPTATRIALSGSIAALAFAAQSHVESIGRSDRDEFIERELSWENLAKVAWERNGMSAVTPTATDIVSHFAGGNPIFTNRNSQLARDPMSWVANPTTDLMANTGSALGNTVQAALQQKPFTGQDLRRYQMLLPFGRMLGVEQIFNAMGSQLPGEE